MELRGLRVEYQVVVDINYKGKILKGQRVDMIVEELVVIELKAVSKLPDVATAQTLSYLKATGLKTALLINFSGQTLVEGVKRLSL